MSEQDRSATLTFFVLINHPVDLKRLILADALRAAGHMVHICTKTEYPEIMAEFVTFERKNACDWILTFSWSFVHSGGRQINIPAFKAFWERMTANVAVMWDDNPLRWHRTVLAASRFVRRIRHFVIDSNVVRRLLAEGIEAAYFPIYYVDPRYMTRETPAFTPDTEVLFCGNIAGTDQFFEIIPNDDPELRDAARKFLALKKDTEDYVDEFDFATREALTLNAVDQPRFLGILTGIQRTVDRIRILRKIPATIRVGLVGHNLSDPDIPAHMTKYPGVSHAAMGHVHALPIMQFGTSGWPAACHLRMFQAAAMGGIMFHEDRPDARRHFVPEADGLFYTDTDHLIASIGRGLADPEPLAAAAVAMKGRFAREHTVPHRARQFVALLRDA